MCLITTQKEPLIAEEDMIVYKSFKEGLISPFEEFKYERGITYETEIKESDDWNCFDYQDLEYLGNNFPTWTLGENEELKCFGEEFHSALQEKRLSDIFDTKVILKCIIPKGSLYYTEPTGLIVSNKIQIPLIL